MYCTNCGKVIPEESTVCPFCKTTISKEIDNEVVSLPASSTDELMVSHYLAIASIVCDVLALFTMGVPAIIGLILAVLSIKKNKTNKLAKAGLIFAVVCLALGVVLLVAKKVLL